jgi:hypothetical protein
MMKDWAKMIGITPAAFTRNGTKLFWPSWILPRPTTFLGICTGICRAPIVIETTAAVVPIITKRSAPIASMPISPIRNASQVLTTAPGSPR